MSPDNVGERAPLALRDYLGVLWRRSWIVLGVAAIVFGAGLYRSEKQTRVYQAQGQLVLANASGATTASAGTDLQTQIGIVASPTVHDSAARTAPGIGNVSAQQSGQGNIITVSSLSTDPVQAARTVNATMAAYAAYVQRQAQSQSTAAATALQDRIDTLSRQIRFANTFRPPPQSALGQKRDSLVAERLALQQSLTDLQPGLASAGTGTGITVIAKATPPTTPIRPKPRSDGLLALGAGLLLGLVIAFLVEYLARTKEPDEANDLKAPRAASDVTVLGTIPVASNTSNEVVSLSAPDSEAAGPYRTLRAAASFMGLERGRCLEVTSAPDREGKTETLTNLAVQLARTGRRVIVVDCDLLKPRVHEFFGLANEIGFTSVMRGVPLVEALQRVPGAAHLYALTSGPVPRDTNRMLASEKCTQILSSLLVGGTIVLIDAPPMLPVADAYTIATTAPVDAVMVVATAKADERDRLRQALDRLQSSRARQVGVVFTTRTDTVDGEPVRRRHWRHNRSSPVDDIETWTNLKQMG